MTVTVTQKHIDEGKARESSSCPVALAIKEVVGHEIVYVSKTRVYTTELPKTLPIEAVIFIKHYDSGDPVGPFSFEL